MVLHEVGNRLSVLLGAKGIAMRDVRHGSGSEVEVWIGKSLACN